MTIDELVEFAKKIRKNILFAAFHAGTNSAHIGGALSISDIMAVLYGAIMNVNSKNPLDDNRDRFILSKGHACLALYSALVEKNFLKKDELMSFEKDNSFLLGHPIINKKLGIEFSTGSLGMGLSLGLGTSIAAKKKNKQYNTYVILGDGECNEGSVWESIMAASHLKLNNLKIIVDKNNFQQTGENSTIMNLGSLSKKFTSFGWEVEEIDGHNVNDIFDYFSKKNTTKKPSALIANTVKGKGISFFENDSNWHHSVLSKSMYEKALEEIK